MLQKQKYDEYLILHVNDHISATVSGRQMLSP